MARGDYLFTSESVPRDTPIKSAIGFQTKSSICFFARAQRPVSILATFAWVARRSPPRTASSSLARSAVSGAILA